MHRLEFARTHSYAGRDASITVPVALRSGALFADLVASIVSFSILMAFGQILVRKRPRTSFDCPAPQNFSFAAALPLVISSAQRSFSLKLLRFRLGNEIHTGVLTSEGIAPVTEINSKHGTQVPNDLLAIIQSHSVGQLDARGVPAIPYAEVQPLLPYPVPPKIWCIGLNYKSHAVDIDAVQPDEPGSFMKPAGCLFEPGGEIELPPLEVSNDVDAEGELGIIIGRDCRYLETGNVESVIFGYTVTLDLTALDVLRKNPRYLTRAKSFDTFFSFGPVVVTRDEVPDVDRLVVNTEHNGAVFSSDVVANMHTRPYEIVRFHSNYMTLQAGDVISTGCPKGARIQPGDRVAGRIDGVGAIAATVAKQRRERRTWLG